MSKMDRVLRVIVGAVIVILTYLYLQGNVLSWIAYLVTVILILTGLTGFCPLYKVVGVTTN
ncbi:hypothetical protein AKJ50_02410 [candidate division MSBL1 archaeon SCGC-AAA382A13]|uniref:Inner membrane protein YgaP-like transmembrane domain-containing protein n=1 Tax=candidate division MSBL1 archaeon SCGC-AAA382A13 TaxID=1698279 RepID=A0A133VDA6_9EURY|nr:hypothetical protein AKJ50_02410 [candidate division MSBL1 archaeon SCGC-AAA382A13]